MFFIFFFNDTATTEIYTLSLHDALPISSEERLELAIAQAEKVHPGYGSHVEQGVSVPWNRMNHMFGSAVRWDEDLLGDRKSTRLNSSHSQISYAVFCLKKKKKKKKKIYS